MQKKKPIIEDQIQFKHEFTPAVHEIPASGWTFDQSGLFVDTIGVTRPPRSRRHFAIVKLKLIGTVPGTAGFLQPMAGRVYGPFKIDVRKWSGFARFAMPLIIPQGYRVEAECDLPGCIVHLLGQNVWVNQ